MVRPLFIICSESGAVDRYTNSISAFSVLESVQIVKAPTLDQAMKSGSLQSVMVLPIKLVCVWLADAEDFGKEYSFKCQIQRPQTNQWELCGEGTFVWRSRSHRIMSDIVVGNALLNEGTLFIACSIRREGEDWLTQQYEIFVDIEELVEAGTPAKG